MARKAKEDESPLSQWAKGGFGDEPELDEDTVGLEEEEDEEVEVPEAIAELVELVRHDLARIEKSADQFGAELLLGDADLDDEDAQQLVDDTEALDDDLVAELSEIDQRKAMAVATALKNELEEVTPGVLAAWLYRAGQLV